MIGMMYVPAGTGSSWYQRSVQPDKPTRAILASSMKRPDERLRRRYSASGTTRKAQRVIDIPRVFAAVLIRLAGAGRTGFVSIVSADSALDPAARVVEDVEKEREA